VKRCDAMDRRSSLDPNLHFYQLIGLTLAYHMTIKRRIMEDLQEQVMGRSLQARPTVEEVPPEGKIDFQ